MRTILLCPVRVAVVVIARVVGPHMIYPKVALESVEATIHYYSTPEVNKDAQQRGTRAVRSRGRGSRVA